ncbi:MAG: glucose 1-dehydrogenase [Chloroflexota bacterium]|nr:glucose 1-dehydrogenase [Chloroflexota bacterium]MDE2961490.1 glucose 1-dehydrogenase [Chloroflexota bacterium]
MARLDGKVALISGGARGMGASEARLFAREGAAVVIGDILDEEGEATAASIAADGGRCRYVHLDVTREADWQTAVAEAVGQFGSLDVLVNNAGIGSSSFQIHEEPVELWDRTIDVNLKGVFLGTRAAVPAMLEAGGGSIINISSQLGIVGVPYNGSAYQTSKGGVRIFTKAAALQYANRGIRVNSVHPGPIVTEMTRAGRDDPERLSIMLARIPMGRYGEAEEVANAVLYLASDESSFVTGSEVVVDGGWTAQ